MRERRRYPRRLIAGCRAELFRLRWILGPLPVASQAPVRNLSETGAMLISQCFIRRGKRVEILILGERRVVSFRVKGRVRWIDEDRTRLGTKYFLIGVEFDPIPTVARKHLVRLMSEPKARTSRRTSPPGSARWNPPRPSSRRQPVVGDSGPTPR